MDKAKIGKFISSRRKDRQLTQEQLAERLGTTNKSVSKWENGICMPDPSIYEPLCSILGITINELFAGQRLKDEEYRRAADDNLMQLLKSKLYRLSDQHISFEEFDRVLTQIAELTAILKSFKTKEDAICHMIKETSASYEECSRAYDFYINLFTVNEIEG